MFLPIYSNYASYITPFHYIRNTRKSQKKWLFYTFLTFSTKQYCKWGLFPFLNFKSSLSKLSFVVSNVLTKNVLHWTCEQSVKSTKMKHFPRRYNTLYICHMYFTNMPCTGYYCEYSSLAFVPLASDDYNLSNAFL